MSTLTCDHCGEYTCEYTEARAIMWCEMCLLEDRALLDAISRVHNAGEGNHFIWVMPESIRLIGKLPKKWKAQPPIDFSAIEEKLSKVTFVPETKPCSRKYYGLSECTCGKCPPKRYTINTNPFKYGF